MASRKPKKSLKPTHTAGTSKNACGTLPDHLQKEWFDLSPATSVARRTPAAWLCANNHTWHDTKEHRLRGAGCPACAAANGKSPQATVRFSPAEVEFRLEGIADGKCLGKTVYLGGGPELVTMKAGTAKVGKIVRIIDDGTVVVSLAPKKVKISSGKPIPESVVDPAFAAASAESWLKADPMPAKPLGENQVSLVVDTSGSMAGGMMGGPMRDDAVAALNSIVSEIKNRAKSTGIPTTIRLLKFNNNVTAGKFTSADSFALPQMPCSGGTALRDAISDGIGNYSPLKAADGGPVTRLVMVLTDGEENASRTTSFVALQDLVKNAQATDMYTIAILVPKGAEEKTARLTGVPAGNIRGWDVASATGAADAGKAASSAVAGYYNSRSKGVTRSTRFFVDASKVTQNDVAAVAKPLASCKVWRIEKETVIREAVESRGYEFREGCGYYELSKGERLRAGRAILLQSRSGGVRAPVYAGEGLRALLGIPEGEHLIGEGTLGDWRVYVQSTSFNRKLVRGTLFVYRTDGNNGGVSATWRPDPSKFKELLASRNGDNSYLVSHEVAANLHIGSLVKIGGVIREVSDIQSDRQMVNARITAAPWVAPK